MPSLAQSQSTLHFPDKPERMGILMDLYEGSLLHTNTFEEKWFVQMRNAVRACHAKGIIHCDIKPDNIFIKNGDAYLGDFGAAIELAPGEDTRMLYLRGTYHWWPPEHRKAFDDYKTRVKKLPYNAAVDAWAMGCLLTCFRKQSWGHIGGDEEKFLGDVEVAELLRGTL